VLTVGADLRLRSAADPIRNRAQCSCVRRLRVLPAFSRESLQLKQGRNLVFRNIQRQGSGGTWQQAAGREGEDPSDGLDLGRNSGDLKVAREKRELPGLRASGCALAAHRAAGLNQLHDRRQWHARLALCALPAEVLRVKNDLYFLVARLELYVDKRKLLAGRSLRRDRPHDSDALVFFDLAWHRHPGTHGVEHRDSSSRAHCARCARCVRCAQG
jgi:hypothetical protein